MKQPDLEVPQEVNLKKKGSFLGGLIKKGSKAKDVEDVSLKYKGKLKDNNEDIDVKANLEGGKYCAAKMSSLQAPLDSAIVLQHGISPSTTEIA